MASMKTAVGSLQAGAKARAPLRVAVPARSGAIARVLSRPADRPVSCKPPAKDVASIKARMEANEEALANEKAMM